VFALVALICASPFDAVAVSTRDALTKATVPGLISAHHDPHRGWSATLELPFHGLANCVQAAASSAVCTRLDSHEPVEFPALRPFFDAVGAPNDTFITIELGSNPLDYALLSFRNRDAAEHRLVLSRDGLAVTGPLPAVTFEGAGTAPVVETVRWPFLVLSYSEGGNGNNASGSVWYRLVQLVERDDGVSIGSVLELGGGQWGRAVTDSGFMHGSSVDLACPSFEPPIITTRRVCEGDVDPRGWPRLESLCRTTAPCTRARTPRTPRIGRWSIRAKSLQPVGVARRDGVVRISELADVHSVRLSEVELINPSPVAQDLTGTMLAAPKDEWGWVMGSCVIGPGETVVVSRDFERTDCLVEGDDRSMPEVLVLRRGARVLDRLAVTLGDEEEPEFEEPPSWQLDPKGRRCLALPSLGRANQPCSKK